MLPQKRLLLATAVGLLLFELAASQSARHTTLRVGATDPAVITNAIADPNTTPTVVRPDPVKLRQFLDQENIPAAVQEIEAGWKKSYEDYYQRPAAGELMSVQATTQVLAQNDRLTGRKSALIYAIPTPQALEIVLITAQGKPLHVRVNDASKDNLEATIKTFRTAIVNPETTPATYLPSAQKIYQWLVKPLEAELQNQGIDTLIFCMGARLRSTPLAALHDGNQFLAEKYRTAIIPAFSLLDQRPTQLRSTKVLAMGASQFKDLAPLPAVPVELSVIANHLWSGDELLNQNFTIENLIQKRTAPPEAPQADSYGIIHLATHAEFSPGDVNQSYIQFWDQRLPLSQLAQLNLHAPVVQLLVLSACRTALGDTKAELGFAGLALQSGSQAAIASLWSVSDTGTLVLMSELYRQLQTTPIKAEALQNAQIALLKKQVDLNQDAITRALQVNPNSSLHSELVNQADLSHPYYWAAFTLIGNPW
jgi:CHAT domain-containing protein